MEDIEYYINAKINHLKEHNTIKGGENHGEYNL
jgi:hypothetical protein